MPADIGQAFQNSVHAWLRAQREFSTGGLIVNFTKRNSCLNRLPHRFAGKQGGHDRDEKWDQPEQHHVPWVGGRQAGKRDGQQRRDSDAGAEQLSHHQGRWMPSHHAESHPKRFLLLPFFHGTLERVFGSGEAVTVRIGEIAARLDLVRHANPDPV